MVHYSNITLTLCVIISCFVLLMFINSYVNTVAVKSTKDDKYYQVQDNMDKKDAANTLAFLKKSMQDFTNALHDRIVYYNGDFTNDGDIYRKAILRFYNTIHSTDISENIPMSVYTSYSINKGEKIVFCLRDKEKNELHDKNLLMYVALHEMAHIGCIEYNHTPLFKKIFAFLVKEATKMGYYKHIPFSDVNSNYCGMVIKQSII